MLLLFVILGRGDHFRFGSVFQDKNRFKPVWFGFFLFGLVFPGLAWFFLVWLGFFPVWVRFGFFGFQLIKPNRTSWFF
jgi:hypothetical protein